MKIRSLLAVVVVCIAVVFVGNANAFIGFYTVEASYLADLALYASGTIYEGFEGTDWDIARYPTEVPSVTSQGLTWSTDLDGVTTGSGWTRTGLYGVFNSYGDPDRLFSIHGSAELVGAGGWFAVTDGLDVTLAGDNMTLTYFAPWTGHQFLGIINSDGLGSVSMYTSDGHWGADDFTFGTTVPEPTTMLLLGSGLLGLGILRRKK